MQERERFEAAGIWKDVMLPTTVVVNGADGLDGSARHTHEAALLAWSESSHT